MAAVKFSHDYCVMLTLYFTAFVYNSQQGTIAIVLPRFTIFYYQIQIRSLPCVNSSHSCYILQHFALYLHASRNCAITKMQIKFSVAY